MSWEFLSENLPHATATLNAVTTVLLVLAVVNIKRGRARVHKKFMLWAITISALFLVLYLLHKVALYEVTGAPNTKFPRETAPVWATTTYYVILVTHLLLAMTVPFLALRAVYLAMKGRIVAHKKLVRYAFPIWMYVSITGVLVYLMLYQLFPAA